MRGGNRRRLGQIENPPTFPNVAGGTTGHRRAGFMSDQSHLPQTETAGARSAGTSPFPCRLVPFEFGVAPFESGVGGDTVGF
jgi:hypothetical protein